MGKLNFILPASDEISDLGGVDLVHGAVAVDGLDEDAVVDALPLAPLAHGEVGVNQPFPEPPGLVVGQKLIWV